VRSRRHFRLFSFAFLALLVFPQSVFALLNIDGTRNQVFVFGELRIAYDSNVFAQEGGEGDTITTAMVGAEYLRNAGTVSVFVRGEMSREMYANNSDRNAWNPSFRAEFARTTGRLTGRLSLSAVKASRADSALNLRTSSWHFPVDLQLKYPINEKTYLTANTGYSRRKYEIEVTPSVLRDLTEYSQGLDLFRIYTSKLDLFAGYRYRLSVTSDGKSDDHNFSVGATGALLPKLNGLVRFGYQIRNFNPEGSAIPSGRYGAFSALGQLNWNATRKFAMTGTLSRDFSTTANATSVDTFSAQLHANYIFTRRWSASTGIGAGRNNFLNEVPTIPPTEPRHDTFFSWDAGVTYTHSEKFRASVMYTHLRNSSTLAISNFTSNGVSLTLSSRF
jgi:hypothetical protein